MNALYNVFKVSCSLKTTHRASRYGGRCLAATMPILREGVHAREPGGDDRNVAGLTGRGERAGRAYERGGGPES